MASEKYQIPFDENGDLISDISYYDPRFRNNLIISEWRDNTEFSAIMNFESIQKGQYSDKFMFVNEFGDRFQMTSNNFMKCVKSMNKGVLTGRFTYARWHKTYGIRFVGED